MEESLIRRMPPHSVEAERAVIGSMMMDGDAVQVASEFLVPQDFYNGQYGMIFSVLVDIYRQGTGIDLVTVQERLRKMELSPEMTSVEFIGGLVNSVPTSVNIRDYVEVVQEKSILRQLIKAGEKMTADAYMDRQALGEILEDAEKQLFDVVQRRSSGKFENIRDVVLQTLDDIEQAAKQEGNITGLGTGFRDLDYRTAGLQKSDLILIAARPAMGKTAFALNLVEHIVSHGSGTVAIFSLEMSKGQLVKRLLAMNAKIDSQQIRAGSLDDEEWGRLMDSVRLLGNSNLVIDDTAGITAAELRSRCRRLKMEKGLDMVVIDYLQLMSGGVRRRNENRQQEVSDITRALKVMARELDVPVIALSQLSRAVEQRQDKRPMLSDLRESGAIEQDADIVMFLYRDEYYNPDTEAKGQAEVIIAKQRNGSTGSVHLAWLARYTKFCNMMPEGIIGRLEDINTC